MELQRITRSLPCKLTAAEFVARGQELAETVQGVNNEELNQKGIRDQLKAKLTELQSKQARLASVVARSEEYREVIVILEARADGKAQEAREDTGEILNVREMRDDEKQLALVLALGGTQRCPECQGTKYINRVVSVTDWEWHRYYMIVDCLNCSGAKG